MLLQIGIIILKRFLTIVEKLLVKKSRNIVYQKIFNLFEIKIKVRLF